MLVFLPARVVRGATIDSSLPLPVCAWFGTRVRRRNREPGCPPYLRRIRCKMGKACSPAVHAIRTDTLVRDPCGFCPSSVLVIGWVVRRVDNLLNLFIQTIFTPLTELLAGADVFPVLCVIIIIQIDVLSSMRAILAVERLFVHLVFCLNASSGFRSVYSLTSFPLVLASTKC